MTPNLGQYGVTSPHIQNLDILMKGALMKGGLMEEKTYFLQTSPEYAMKRLLAEGCGSIYQITSAFRGSESGNRHNPEFTLLEWYRPSLSLEGLMEELDALLSALCSSFQICRENASFVSYRHLFQNRYNANPHQLDVGQLHILAKDHFPNLVSHLDEDSGVDDVLDLLFSAGVEPSLIKPHFVFDYPASQSALAKLETRSGDTVALRFELFWQGMELANGYDELTDAKELRQRFIRDNETRASKDLDEILLDENLLACLENLPECTGVALGLDRLQMLLTDVDSIKQVLSFSIEDA